MNYPRRPHTTLVLATSLDGKIADYGNSPALFTSEADSRHLEAQVAIADAVMVGATTLRAYGQNIQVRTPALFEERQHRGQPPQPIQIVCSASGQLDPEMDFFRQDIPRWLLTSPDGGKLWEGKPHFARVIINEKLGEYSGDRPDAQPILDNWQGIFQELAQAGIQKLTLLGGGTLVADLLRSQLIDEWWLTLCPLVLGGTTSVVPVAGQGYLEKEAPRLELLEHRELAGELFLHYRFLYAPETQTPKSSI